MDNFRFPAQANDDIPHFRGTPEELCLISNSQCFGPAPLPGTEIEQHLTVMADGRVRFASCRQDDLLEDDQPAKRQDFRIAPETARNLLSAVSHWANRRQETAMATDVGFWTLELTNTEGESCFLEGSLGTGCLEDDATLSDLIRDTLNMGGLFALDGNPDRVLRVTVDFRQTTQGVGGECQVYTEQLVADRTSSMLELVQTYAPDTVFSRKLQSGEIADLLDALDPDTLFGEIEGNPEDAVDDPGVGREYTVTVDFKRRPQQVFRGSYDKKALPEDWGDFADTLWWLLQEQDMGMILDRAIYGKAKRRTAGLMYCAVTFGNSGKQYHYISDDETISVGDFVLAPVGPDNCPMMARVTEVGFYQEDQAPYPPEKAKHILEKLVPPAGENGPEGGICPEAWVEDVEGES